MTPHGSDWDDADDNGLDAFDFGTPQVEEDASDLDALPDFQGGLDVHDDHGTGLDAVHDYANHDEVEDHEDDGFGALDGRPDDDDEEQIPVVQAINPPGTVTVTAYLNGSVAQVDLDRR